MMLPSLTPNVQETMQDLQSFNALFPKSLTIKTARTLLIISVWKKCLHLTPPLSIVASQVPKNLVDPLATFARVSSVQILSYALFPTFPMPIEGQWPQDARNASHSLSASHPVLVQRVLLARPL
jgi:hypothetical protein